MDAQMQYLERILSLQTEREAERERIQAERAAEREQQLFAMMERMAAALSKVQQNPEETYDQQTPHMREDRPLSGCSRGSQSSRRSSLGSASTSATSVAKELLRQVPQFSGSSQTPQPLLEFIHKMNQYLETVELTPQLEAKLAISKLTGTALSWFMQLEASGSEPRTWTQLQAALRERFTPPAFTTSILDKLNDLTQTTSVIAYNNVFNLLIMQLSASAQNPEILRWRYCKGLKSHIYTAIIGQTCQDLAALQAAAVEQEQMSNRRISQRAPPQTPTVEAHFSQDAPKNLDRRGSSRNNSEKPSWRPNHFKTGANNYKNKKMWPCSLCKKEGHYTSACPDLQKAQRAIQTPSENNTAEANIALATDFHSSHSIALDSCATRHMVKDVFLLTDLHPIPTAKVTGITKDGTPLISKQAGTLTIQNDDSELVLKDVLYVPDAGRNLISVAPLRKQGYRIVFDEDSAIHKDGVPVLKLRYNGDLPFIEGYVETPVSTFVTETAKETTAMSLNYGIHALGTSDRALFKLRI